MPIPPTRRKKSVIAISSHVARGSVGNRAAVFALEALGHPVWSVPTIALPWHPGHGPSTAIVPDAAAFEAFIGDLERAPWTGEVGAVLTGYFGAPGQVEPVARLIRSLKRRDPAVLYICDPVIGDTSGLYVSAETAAKVRDVLLPLADIATPNRFELDWFTGGGAIAESARSLGPARVLVTSAIDDARTGNVLIGRNDHLSIFHQTHAVVPKGLGDVTAALFLAHLLDGFGDGEALRRATASVLGILEATLAHGADELALESALSQILAPTASIAPSGSAVPHDW